ncbi:MAG: ion transporter [Thermostichales cyanobacterium BF3_bins_165]
MGSQNLEKIRQRIWEIIEVAKPGDRASRIFDIFMFTTISLNVLAVILVTVESFAEYKLYFDTFEIFSVIVFTLDYLARIWCCTCSPRYAYHPIIGRLHFLVQPLSIFDFLSFAPFYLPFLGIDFHLTGLFRLFRLLRIGKLARYLESFQLLARVFISKKDELISSMIVLGILLIFASALMYNAEHYIQPQAFPDIPTAMWWAVVTLTTVGYGDVHPISPQGRLLGSILAILGIGVFALPTAILGSGFLEEVQKRKSQPTCPHCGKPLQTN